MASTPEGEEGDDVWGSCVSSVEQKYIKLQLGDDLYCEIWKSRSKEGQSEAKSMAINLVNKL